MAEPCECVVRSIDAGIAGMELLEEVAKRRRRDPLYWTDRALRAVLGFPSYLVGLLLGLPRERLCDSRLGNLIDLVGLAVAIVGTVAAGDQAGWW